MSVGLAGQASARTLKQTLLSGVAWTVGTRVVAGLSGFTVNALLSHLLLPEDLGAYFLLVSVASAGALTAQLGLQVAVVRLVAEAIALGCPGRARGVARVALATVAVAGALAGLLFAIFGGTAALLAFDSAALAEVAWLGGAWLAGLALMTVVAEIFRGLHDYRMAGVLGGAASSILFLAVLLAVLTLKDSATLPVATALGAAAIAATALSGIAILERRMRGLGTAVAVTPAEVLAVGLPLLVTSLAILISTQADIWILGMYREKEEVAVYGAAVRLIQLVLMPLLMLNAVLAPVISQLFSKGQRERLERLMRSSAALTGLPALVALALLFAAAAPLLSVVYGDYYRSGATALLLVSAGQAVNVLCGPAAILLMMSGHQRAAMTISLVTGAGVVAGGMAAVERFGLNGVAAVAGAAAALHGLASWAWVRRSTGLWTHCGFGSMAEMAGELRRALRGSRG